MARWDAFIAGCPMGTFLHSRKFLSYHGDRFEDCSLLLSNGDKLLAVLPAAKLTNDTVASHPGATYGGIVHAGELYGNHMREALIAVAAYYRQNGFHRLLYKVVPDCYRRFPCDDDIFALQQAGGELLSCDLSTVIDFRWRGKVHLQRRRSIKKAVAAGVVVCCGNKHASAAWDLLEQNLRERHNVQPTHTLDEILFLARQFSQNIKFYVGMVSGEAICAVTMFITDTVWHTQYIASNDAGRRICGLGFLFETLIEQAVLSGARYFSFGTSQLDGEIGGD